MGDVAVTYLLDNMADLCRSRMNLISSANVELEMLMEELTDMKVLLNHASEKKYREEDFKVWERNLRNVVYEVEDAIDTCITEAAIAQKGNWFKKYFNVKPKTLAERIKPLREGNMKDVLEASAVLMANLRFVRESYTNDEIKPLRNKHPRIDAVVGFEDEAEKLVGYLLQPSVGLDVVTIVGMPGLGKTTVAWKIYQDPRIKYEYPALIWVVVSNEFNKRDVLLTILKRFTNTDTISDDLSVDLENMVKEYLERSKFLLFLDDVWTVEVWREIFEFLPKDTDRGRVLITTRLMDVGLHANHNRHPHMLRFLNEEESSLLLRLEVFNNPENFPPELEEYGKLISRRCDGLPLAIKVVGGILAVGTKDDWRLISENPDIMSYTDYGSMEKMISLSYNSLPYDLKYCFLYVGGMFPEDSKISSWELIQLWIAEGFIKQDPSGKPLEATALDNLKELINRNLVMIDKTRPNGEVKTCRIQNSVREFCITEAGYENQNLFQEVKKSDDGTFEYNENQKCRRLSVHSFVKEFFLKRSKATKLYETRSFLSFTKPINLKRKEIPAFTEVFQLLRVFNAKTINFPKFPIKITELLHLRFLTLLGKNLKMLPPAITDLWNLQTLMVETRSSTLEIQANIWHMLHLRHVKTKSPIVLTCKDFQGHGGDELQTLDKLSPESCTEEVFEKARNLKTLGIRGDISILADSRCLKPLLRLEKLKLENFFVHEAASENPVYSLPHVFPETIRFLTLSSTYLRWSHMSTVGQIPCLEVLKLKKNAFRGDRWESIAGGFHNLEHLYIIGSDNLMLWRIKGGGDPFPRLQTVVIRNCEKLESVPINLMRKLDKLVLDRVTEYAVLYAREVEEEIKQESGTKRGQFKLVIGPGDA